MSYEKAITIKEAIQSILNQDYILPSIQREFVWGESQIEILFDSILRDYPISTFLFWKVKGENINRFKFYRFLSFYHERDKRHNDLAELSIEKDRFAVLDGQQRLTSLYIGLRGSYAKKLPNYNWKSDHAFPKKQLYINILENAGNGDKEYDFRFLSDSDIHALNLKHPGKYHWFKVGKILDFNELTDIFNYITEHSLLDTSKYSKEQCEFSGKTLSRLLQYFNKNEIINFYLEKTDELDKVLNIFIRVNSGGTKLSYSDLLLSIATAEWKGKDAREIIHRFVDQINSIGAGFNIDKDLVLKSCLVLSEIRDIKFKVDNFSSDNMEKIESEWDEISKALNISVQLIAHLGFSDKTLTAHNAIIPIAYFLKKNNIGEEIIHSSLHTDNKKKIKEWLIRALLKKVFGGTPDNLYPVYRKIISDNPGIFPLSRLIDHYKGSNKSLSFDDATIDHLMNTQYGSAFSYMLLSLIYPLNHNYTFHQDHIFPKKYFNHKQLAHLGITDDALRLQFMSRFNLIGNIQLIQETENLEKSSILFDKWLENKYQNQELMSYKMQNFIPKDCNLSINNFLTFYEERRQLIKSRLVEILNVLESKDRKDEQADRIIESSDIA